MSIDHAPAAQRLAGLIATVSDDQLDAPTPCPHYTVGDLVDHIGGFAMAFDSAARKEPLPESDAGPSGDANQLEDGWRERIGRDLSTLAAAWHDPQAWQGMTRVGGIDLPGESAGMFALDELVVHGWDLAVATGRPYDVDQPSLEANYALLSGLAQPGQEQAREGLFGPPIELPDSAPLLDRVIGLTGRDPRWSPLSG